MLGADIQQLKVLAYNKKIVYIIMKGYKKFRQLQF